MIAEGDRRIHVGERLDTDAHASDDDVAVVEDAAEDRLVDVDALDLVEMHLDGAPADEAALVDDAAVGHRNLGCPAAEPGDEQQYGRAGEYEGRQPVPYPPGADRQPRVAEPEDQRRKDQQQKAGQVDGPMEIGGVAYVLARLQHALDVAHGRKSSGFTRGRALASRFRSSQAFAAT